MSSAAAPMIVTSQPQYALIAQALIDDIVGGTYPVGAVLPPELELCTQFGVSRHTVREAMRMLQERGLVTRRRGIGTLVKTTRIEPHYVQSTASIADLLQYVEETRLVTTETTHVVADAALAQTLRCPEGQRWLHVHGFRYIGTNLQPIALTDIYIHAAYAGVKKLIGVQKVPVYTLIEKQYGERVVEVRQQIDATLVSDVDADALGVARGSAGLVVTRHYIGSDERILEVAVNLHPAERFSYSQALRLKSTRAA